MKRSQHPDHETTAPTLPKSNPTTPGMVRSQPINAPARTPRSLLRR